MTEQEFVDKVMEGINIADPQDLTPIRSITQNLFRDGFSIRLARKFLYCMEEVNPNLPEDVALARMAKLRKMVENGRI